MKTKTREIYNIIQARRYGPLFGQFMWERIIIFLNMMPFLKSGTQCQLIKVFGFNNTRILDSHANLRNLFSEVCLFGLLLLLAVDTNTNIWLLFVSMCYCRSKESAAVAAFRAVSYSEYQIITKPWAWKPPVLDELTKFGQRESAPAILSLYQGK